MLQSSSPAINAGSVSGAPSTDYSGTVRPQSTGIDIGAYEVNISAPLTITTSTLPNGTLGVSYSQTLVATGGTVPYTWSSISGILPSGLTLNASGVISGTPTTITGPISITYKVTDNVGATTTKIISITTGSTSWDVNKDGVINVLDMIAISQSWSATGTPGWISQDVNNDGVINSLDMIIVGQHWSG
jgi:hypothetical protein